MGSMIILSATRSFAPRPHTRAPFSTYSLILTTLSVHPRNPCPVDTVPMLLKTPRCAAHALAKLGLPLLQPDMQASAALDKEGRLQRYIPSHQAR